MMIGFPKEGASASLTVRGMIELKIKGPRVLRTSSTTCLDRFVRSSYIVSTIPSMCRSGLKNVRTSSSVRSKSGIPSMQKNSHWTGIRIESAAARALMVRNPSEGGQSIRMKLKLFLMGSKAAFSFFSLFSWE